MDIPRLERLTVKVHLLGEPCLWCWEIVDVEDDATVESSWATEWTGYASSREALQAGAIRLSDLTRSSRSAKLDARFTPVGDQRTQPRYLVVVARAATTCTSGLSSLKSTMSRLVFWASVPLRTRLVVILCSTHSYRDSWATRCLSASRAIPPP